MFWFQRLPLGLLLLLHLAAAVQVFMDGNSASQVLSRRRRANSFFEEVKQGNLERECYEERCDQEEAREIFENAEKTEEFWAKYADGDACESRPCAHGGICKDTVGGYTCFCESAYKGYNCEIAIPELCENSNGGCKHFCRVEKGNVLCSCADGYDLAGDDKSCFSNEEFKCGVIFTGSTRTVFRYERPNATHENVTGFNDTDFNPNVTEPSGFENRTNDPLPKNYVLESLIRPQKSSMTRIVGGEDCPPGECPWQSVIRPQQSSMTRVVGGEDCPPGECPWQALLLNEAHRGFCGGTILNEYIILTAAHCMNESRYIYVTLGEFDILVNHGNEVVRQVESIIAHNKYRPDTYHNDIALIKLSKPIKFSRYILPACLPESDFAEKVLMRQPQGLVSGFGRIGEGRQPSTILQRLNMPYVDRSVCMESTSLRITARMFCAGYDTEAKDACQGDSGGPHVTRYGDTYFVTGIVSWGEGCARKGKYGVYTQVSKYVRWIREGMAKLMSTNRKKRHLGHIERLYL